MTADFAATLRDAFKTVLGLAVLAAGLAAGSARAEDAPQNCEVPAYLLSNDSVLPKVGQVLKAGQRLDILVVGSRSSTIGTSDGTAAYPARLQVMLREKLPAVDVNVSVELQVKKTAEEIAPSLEKLVEDRKPTLVIWQTGTVDAMRSVDPDDFRGAIDDGVAAMQKAGADVILMNLQYSPRTETMISPSAYLDNMRVVAQQYDVPLFDRFAIMRQWNEAGDFDLFSASHGVELAKRVHDCLGRALSTFVIDAAHINQIESGTQR
jgi:GDSL-like lipase/acylhydrolase family protein